MEVWEGLVRSHGGSSGGGNINIFIKGVKSDISWNFNVEGGKSAYGAFLDGSNGLYGGAGGLGTVNIGTIVGGYYTNINI